MGVVVPAAAPGGQAKLRRTRRISAGVLVVLFSISTVAASIGIWARRTALDTSSFVDTVRPLPRDERISRALAAHLTDLILTEIDLDRRARRALPEELAFLSGALDGIVRNYAEDTVGNVIRSERFDQIWTEAVRFAHREMLAVLRGEEEEVVAIEDGEVALDLLPVIEEVVQDIVSEAPGFLGNITLPDLDDDATRREIRTTLEDALGIELPTDFGRIVVFDEERLSEAQDTVHLLNRFVVLIVVLAILFLAGALFASLDRRRTVVQLGLGVAVTTALVFTVLRQVIDDLLELVPDGQDRDAAHAAATIISRGLRSQEWWLIAIASVIAAVAYLLGPGRVAVWIRGRARWLAGKARAEGVALPGTPAGRWARANVDALRIGGAIAALLVWLIVDETWAGLFIALVLLAAYQAALTWLVRAPARS